ncbi:hypothetical protein J8273_7006 [Carpediemonas membranifera]|uniref:Tubulin binding cofactor C-like domain-containing protein n=1 Tax=Carpediemonas membranifera TaxID=201153 RepID=A0A8J6AXF0_9EUKA|nr:hypothetical protein J8273_7006 [Carpediemonas membranifera]|eukprot:KAG9390753.1 hypothetical protein J8273_7006 [Carpediemonas membranifera]
MDDETEQQCKADLLAISRQDPTSEEGTSEAQRIAEELEARIARSTMSLHSADARLSRYEAEQWRRKLRSFSSQQAMLMQRFPRKRFSFSSRKRVQEEISKLEKTEAVKQDLATEEVYETAKTYLHDRADDSRVFPEHESTVIISGCRDCAYIFTGPLKHLAILDCENVSVLFAVLRGPLIVRSGVAGQKTCKHCWVAGGIQQLRLTDVVGLQLFLRTTSDPVKERCEGVEVHPLLGLDEALIKAMPEPMQEAYSRTETGWASGYEAAVDGLVKLESSRHERMHDFSMPV